MNDCKHRPNETREDLGSRITRVKTGCRTCKIRRVKCDESWPACRRCVLTGRNCDGYGVWGGGGNAYGHRFQSKTQYNSILSRDISLVISRMNGKEQHCLEWFVRRASVKLPGIFGSTFWNTLALSLGSSERAILHATLALGSAHKREMLDIGHMGNVREPPDEQERFTLQQYSKAIHHLRPLFACRSRSSVRMILITCVIFTCLEYLRGRYRTGYAHLQNGLMLLRDLQILPSTRDDDNALILKAPAESIDLWLIETLTRLDVQVTLLGYTSSHSHSIQNPHTPSFAPFTFSSVHEARQYLDILLLGISNLKEKYQKKHIWDSTSTFEFTTSQKHICEASVSWLRAYNASKVTLETGQSFRDALAYRLLLTYHTMAHIMGETSLPTAESIFDSYTDHFHAIITQSLDTLAAASLLTTHDISSGHCTPKFSFTTDIGIIPPLYYTSIKCRDPRIRRQAIHLLETATHQEGIWNGKLMAVISKEVMRIEERDIYDGVLIPDDFSSRSHGAQDFNSLRGLLEYYRLHNVQILLPDDPQGKTILLAEGKQENSTPTTLRREYDAKSRSWA